MLKKTITVDYIERILDNCSNYFKDRVNGLGASQNEGYDIFVNGYVEDEGVKELQSLFPTATKIEKSGTNGYHIEFKKVFRIWKMLQSDLENSQTEGILRSVIQSTIESLQISWPLDAEGKTAAELTRMGISFSDWWLVEEE